MTDSIRTAVVTGGSTGIGLAAAQAFATKGYAVVIAGRDAERGSTAAEKICADGGQARFVQTDVRDDDQVGALAADAARDGVLAAWFNNAGVEGHAGPMSEADDAVVRELLDVNIKGVYSGMRHAANHMGPDGVVVNNASFVGVCAAVPIAVAYGGTKAAVVSMTRSAALALGDQGISVYAVCPFIVDTPMVDRLTGGAGPEARAGFAAQFAPSGQLTRPEEIANVVMSLVSGESGYPSGAVLTVDAGPTVALLP